MGTKMFRSRWFRLSALFAVLLTVFSLSAVTTAEARFGGSFGSGDFRPDHAGREVTETLVGFP